MRYCEYSAWEVGQKTFTKMTTKEEHIKELLTLGISIKKQQNIIHAIRTEFKKYSDKQRSEIYNEVATVYKLILTGVRKDNIYNIHKIITPPGLKGVVSKSKTIIADAKTINQLMDFKRRGTYRYFFDVDSGKIYGIAIHASKNLNLKSFLLF